MGRQVNFYMTRQDEDEFVNFTKQTGNVEILPQNSTTSPVPIHTLPESGAQETDRLFWLYNRSVSTNLVIDYDKDNGLYFVDGQRSSVIEFARCQIHNNIMQAGWIWAEFTTIDNEAMDLGQREREFKKWFETIANWIRKKYFLTGWLVYAGRGALKFQDEGGILP